MQETSETVPTPEKGGGAFLDLKTVINAFSEAGLGLSVEQMEIVEGVASRGLNVASLWDDLKTLDSLAAGIADKGGSETAQQLVEKLRQELSSLHQDGVQQEITMLNQVFDQRPGVYVLYEDGRIITGVEVTQTPNGQADVYWQSNDENIVVAESRQIVIDTQQLSPEEKVAIESYRSRYEV